jgi:hypothetical protein
VANSSYRSARKLNSRRLALHRVLQRHGLIGDRPSNPKIAGCFSRRPWLGIFALAHIEIAGDGLGRVLAEARVYAIREGFPSAFSHPGLE